MGGIYDSFALSEALAAVVHEKAGDEILDRYSESRRKIYLEVTSPISTESLRLVFHSGDQDRLNKDLALLRNRKNDPEAMRKFLSVPAALETPSLITGRTLAHRAAA
jgi:3-(3-hydroxy-phenyl)propionate hydroxylase/6-hydroxy-3-succinoylpyridine 3-monooxygenase